VSHWGVSVIQKKPIHAIRAPLFLALVIPILIFVPLIPSSTVRGADNDEGFLSASCQIVQGEGVEAEHTRTHASDNVRHQVDTAGDGGIQSVGPLAVDPTRKYIQVIYTFETSNFGFLTELTITHEARITRAQYTTCSLNVQLNNGGWYFIAFITGSESVKTWSSTSNPGDYVAADGKVRLMFYASTNVLGSSLLVDYLQVRLIRCTPSGAMSTGATFAAGSSTGGTSYSDTWYYDEVCHVCQTDGSGNLDIRYAFSTGCYPELVQNIIIKGRFKTSAGYNGNVTLYLHNHRLDLWQQVQVWSASTAFRAFEVQYARHTFDFANGTSTPPQGPVEEVDVRWVLAGQSAQLSVDYLRVAVAYSDIQRFAVIVVGGSATDINRVAFVNSGDFVYQQLLLLGFTDENIKYLDPAGPDPSRHVDEPTNRTSIFRALAWWKDAECDGNDIFLLYMVDHGDYPWPDHNWGWFVIDDNRDGDTTDQEDHVFDWEVQSWLCERPTVGRLLVVLDFCKAGMWLGDLGAPAICDIVITAAKAEQSSYNYPPSWPHPSAIFSWQFFGNLTLCCVGDAFNNAARATRDFVRSQGFSQTPQYWDGTSVSDTPSPTNATLYQFSLIL
jgi:hypothetical protein